jgi:peptidoglycan/LPS O-acetylase OafA/YrhL
LTHQISSENITRPRGEDGGVSTGFAFVYALPGWHPRVSRAHRCIWSRSKPRFFNHNPAPLQRLRRSRLLRSEWFSYGRHLFDADANAKQHFKLYSCEVARIVPLYFLVVILSFAAFQFVDPNFTYPITAVQLLRLLTFNGSVSVFWSVGPEVQFYVVFILLWLICARSRLAFFVFAICLSAFCIATIKMWSGVFILSKFHIFACGAMLASIRRSVRLSGTSILAAHIASIALLVAICLSARFSMFLGHEDNDLNLTSFYDSLPRTLIAGIIVFSFSYESAIGSVVFANKAMRFFGAISFSIYLLHEVVMYCFAKWGLLKFAGLSLGTVIMATTVVIISWVSYRVVEMPARVWIKKRLTAAIVTPPPSIHDFAETKTNYGTPNTVI